MSTQLVGALAALGIQSEPADAAERGFHHRHVSAADQVASAAVAFRQAGFYLEMMTAEDRREADEVFRLVYTFNRLGPSERHLLLADVAEGVSAPSMASVYGAADWFEREVWDMYGVPFEGRPDLKRILLPEDVTFHALRKDFGRIEDAPAEGEGG